MTNEHAINVIKDIKNYYNDKSEYHEDGYIGFDKEDNEAIDLAIKALEAQSNRCNSCTHFKEQDGSNCYECVKGMANNFEAQPRTIVMTKEEFERYLANEDLVVVKRKFLNEALEAQPMRDATEEERKSVKDYVESISKPTGVQFDAQPTNAKETIIKSALKYLVKMQIEEGSVGFAVDNDPDHDCCWDNILAWLETQPTHSSTYGDVSWADIRKAYIEGYNYGVKDWFKSKTQPCRNCISRESVIEWLKDKDIIKTKNQEENARKELTELPSVTPSYNSIKTELKPCEDCISREEVQDLISRWLSDYLLDETREALETINYKVGDMPSVTPQRPKGKWIKIQSGSEDFPESIVCSRCKNENSHLDFDEHSEPIGKVFVTSKYCPNCGAEMSGGGEDEVSD